ncbi:hypothetical protein DPSP01_007888 [Paraphaeosphaeria sporulosa]
MRFSSTASVIALGALFLNASAIPFQQGDSLGAVEASLPRGITTSKVDVIPNDKRGVTTSKVDVIPNDRRGVITSKVDVIPNDKRGITTSKVDVIPNDRRGVTTSKVEVLPNETRDAAINSVPRVRVRSGRTRANSRPAPQ